jgi:hypothetical protein
MADEDRVWRRPELIVLVRNRAEEAVLEACKGNGVDASQWTVADSCWYDILGRCDAACRVVASS